MWWRRYFTGVTRNDGLKYAGMDETVLKVGTVQNRNGREEDNTKEEVRK